MILVTGDTHGIIDYAKAEKLYKDYILDKNDYLIIASDFECVWGENTL